MKILALSDFAWNRSSRAISVSDMLKMTTKDTVLCERTKG